MGSQNSNCRNPIEVEKSTSSKKSGTRSTVDEDADDVVVCFSKHEEVFTANDDRYDNDPKTQSNYTTADKNFIRTKGEKEQQRGTPRPGLMVSYYNISIIEYNYVLVSQHNSLILWTARFEWK